MSRILQALALIDDAKKLLLAEAAGEPAPTLHSLQPSDPIKQREDNLRREQQQREARTFNGLSGIPARELTPQDLIYLRHAEENLRHHLTARGKSTPDVFEALLVGTDRDMVSARNRSTDGADVQGERSKYMQDRAAWVDNYDLRGNKVLINAVARLRVSLLG